MKLVIDIDDEQVLFDIKNRSLEAETDTDKVIINALYNGTPLTERPKGRWINKFGKEQGYDIAGIKTWYIQILCDKCGFIKTAIEGHTGQYHYCPNCGAEMSGGSEEDG